MSPVKRISVTLASKCYVHYANFNKYLSNMELGMKSLTFKCQMYSSEMQGIRTTCIKKYSDMLKQVQVGYIKTPLFYARSQTTISVLRNYNHSPSDELSLSMASISLYGRSIEVRRGYFPGEQDQLVP